MAPSPLSPRVRYALLAAIGLGLVVLRWRFLDVPLERDEGEYAYGGQLLLEGVLPYVGIYNMKWPGIYAVFAAIEACFGSGLRAIHFGLIVADLATVAATFLFARRLFDDRVALACSAALALILTLPSVQGSSANAEHFVLPFSLAGFAVLAHDEVRLRRAFFGGLLLGLGMLVKQHGALLAAGGLAGLLLASHAAPWPLRLRSALVAAAGSALPLLTTAALYALAGHFDSFWKWTFQYAASYTQQQELGVAMGVLAERVKALSAEAPLVWGFAVLGLLAHLRHEPARRSTRTSVPFVLGSLLAVAPGLFFRPHYFVLLLPAIALLAALGLQWLLARRPAAWITAIALTLGWTLVAERAWYFQLTPFEVTRRLYFSNPFVESLEVARYLAEHSEPDDLIAVLGSEPQLYVYSNRRAASPYVYTYALMEGHDLARSMQAEMAGQIEAAEPAWIVFVRHPFSWLQRRSSDDWIFRWYEQYSRRYELRARLEMGEPSRLVERHQIDPQAPPGLGMDLLRRRVP